MNKTVYDGKPNEFYDPFKLSDYIINELSGERVTRSDSSHGFTEVYHIDGVSLEMSYSGNTSKNYY